MKKRTRQYHSVKEDLPPTTTTRRVPPTQEEIRQRAHQLFLARGGTPGGELEDWLRAEQELKHAHTATTQ